MVKLCVPTNLHSWDQERNDQLLVKESLELAYKFFTQITDQIYERREVLLFLIFKIQEVFTIEISLALSRSAKN